MYEDAHPLCPDNYRGLDRWCCENSHFLKQLHETHWRVLRSDGNRVLDFWPTTGRYCLFSTQQGFPNKTKLGGENAIIEELEAHYGRKQSKAAKHEAREARRINSEAEKIADAAAPMIAEAVMKQLSVYLQLATFPQSGREDIPIDAALVQECREAVEANRPKRFTTNQLKAAEQSIKAYRECYAGRSPQPSVEVHITDDGVVEKSAAGTQGESGPDDSGLAAPSGNFPIPTDEEEDAEGNTYCPAQSAAIMQAVNEPEGEAAYRDDRLEGIVVKPQCPLCGAWYGMHERGCKNSVFYGMSDNEADEAQAAMIGDKTEPVHPMPSDLLDLSADEFFERATYLVALLGLLASGKDVGYARHHAERFAKEKPF